ncbi:hypothetical protein RRG08_057012 [Elysia crispata]|uniref:DAGKc domain-containing protein n=1 Tax=Elysia crispata TaxID=231223 RepID=A0AAE1DAJ0_9GAST|nr:hypothetical protein RRG08_057012 [Elysia crispata]
MTYLLPNLKAFSICFLGHAQKPRQFFVLINPYSGRKSASRIFHKKVAPLLTACGVSFTTHETRGPGDAANVCRDLDFSNLDGLCGYQRQARVSTGNQQNRATLRQEVQEELSSRSFG